ncbi:pilus assembly protein PilP [Massilia sp. LXY-6]|uniref:pilus assembly protein PilP n=1 Tax=Massilia sp. LXY-6 TaxID=3379823 RepID=UPI003EE0C697
MSKQAGAFVAAALLLAGCGDSDVKEVHDWMDQVKQQTRPAVKPLAEPKDFLPYAYGAKETVDPFSPNKLLNQLAKAAETSQDPNKPDLQRPREQLEGYPLDTMKMVGTMQKGSVTYALLQIDRAVYQVRAGQRIGQNFGIVTRVGDDAINIREVVQDAAGEWVERMAKLELQSKENRK